LVTRLCPATCRLAVVRFGASAALVSDLAPWAAARQAVWTARPGTGLASGRLDLSAAINACQRALDGGDGVGPNVVVVVTDGAATRCDICSCKRHKF